MSMSAESFQQAKEILEDFLQGAHTHIILSTSSIPRGQSKFHGPVFLSSDQFLTWIMKKFNMNYDIVHNDIVQKSY